MDNFTREPDLTFTHLLNAGPGGRAVFRLVTGVVALNPARGLMFVLCFCVVLSCVGRDLFDGLITCLKKSCLTSVLIRLRNLQCETAEILTRTAGLLMMIYFESFDKFWWRSVLLTSLDGNKRQLIANWTSPKADLDVVNRSIIFPAALLSDRFSGHFPTKTTHAFNFSPCEPWRSLQCACVYMKIMAH
jgi:hypothetical protein